MKLVFVTDRRAFSLQPGEAMYLVNRDGMRIGIMHRCLGCESILTLLFAPAHDGHPEWEWNGNIEAPTLKPSILHDKKKGGCGWHGFITNGVMK